MSFGPRLLVATVVTAIIGGTAGFFLLAQDLREAQTSDYAAAQQTDVRRFEAIGRQTATPGEAAVRIGELLAAIAERPGTLETVLIEPGTVVAASGNEANLVGRRDTDPHVLAALRGGTAYAGREVDPARDQRNFQLVAPVRLPAGRYAFEVVYDHRALDATVDAVRRTLVLYGLFTLFGGLAIFYLAGGGALLRSHRVAQQRATRDGLTDLPNHRAFQDELQGAVASATRSQQPLAALALDVDDFTFVNDQRGRPYGDTVLTRVADALRSGRLEDRAYRVGGDEFALLLPRTDGEGARTIAARLERQFAGLEIAVSIGIANLRDGQSAEDLRAETDAALAEAKRRSSSRVAHFDDLRDQTVIATSARTGLVRGMIDGALLGVAYQPIWDLGRARLLGVEALMRPGADSGLTSPAEAFDLAERIGRVHELDVLCVERALRDVPALPDGVLLFVNVSPHTLDLDGDGDEWLPSAVRAAGLAPSQVVIEVTERFTARTDAVVLALARLRAAGFRIAIDDVGTGNAGLEMLQKVSADYVKIDRSIVLAAPTDRNARAVLMAMATYARQTGSFVIAEGIEDRETLDFLNGIEEHDVRPDRIIQGGQGYGLGRPAPGAAPTERPEILSDIAVYERSAAGRP